MANNTIEATLRSRYVDGVSAAVAATQRTMQSALNQMQSAGALASSAVSSAFEGVIGTMGRWQQSLNQAAHESESGFKRISLGAAAMAIGVAAGLITMGKSLATWLGNLIKESSEVLELKLAFEGLANATGHSTNLLARLKSATEGLVPAVELLRNANRMMQSGIKMSDDMYVKLTENIFRLAKASNVDGAQALAALNDGLIRGNARGLQAIGIHINVKDAISEMALANGQNARTLGDSARMQAYYNELLQATSIATSKLPSDFVSVADAIRRTENTWRGFLNSIGEGINRSPVLQELLIKLATALGTVGTKKSDIEDIAKAVNAFIISTLRGAANVADALVVVSTVFGVFYAAIATATNGVVIAVSGMALGVLKSIVAVLDALGRLPGAVGRAMRQAAEQVQQAADLAGGYSVETAKRIREIWGGVGDSAGVLLKFSASSRELAGELQKLSNQVMQGTAAYQAHSEAAKADAEGHKKLIEQMKAFDELHWQLADKTATPQQRALNQYMADLTKISVLDLRLVHDAEEKKAQLRMAAFRNFLAAKAAADEQDLDKQLSLQREGEEAMRQLGQKELKATLDAGQEVIDRITGDGARRAERVVNELLDKLAQEREERRQREVQQTLGAANTIARAVEMSQQGKLSNAAGQNALLQVPGMIAAIRAQISELERQPAVSAAQLDQLTKLREALEKLNTLKFNPIQQAMRTLRQSFSQFFGEAGNAFAQFFSDITTGQEGAGKRLLASFMHMISQMLVQIGTMLVSTGIAEVFAAMTLYGRMMGHSAAAGFRAIAQGAALIALGGITGGAASSLSQPSASSSSSDSSTRQTSVTTPQIITIGRPSGEQSATTNSQPRDLGTLTIRLDRGVIVDEVTTNIKQNGVLRTVIRKATA